MINRNVYARDPLAHRLLNNGVASVKELTTEADRRTLRFELETFVCDGEYERGLREILRNFIDGLGQPEQRGVWVSGFYGSGKSHLVKMLRALWVNYEFPEDGATARSLVKLPVDIQDLLVELDTAGRRFGGVRAVSGTLGQGASDYARMALLSMVFQAVGLAEQYNLAKFELWLKKEGLFDQVKQAVEEQGRTWEMERAHLYVSELISPAILELRPGLASSPEELREIFGQQFPYVQDISNQQMVEGIREALSTEGGEFPLTLIAVDEIQQYIGERADRTYAVQEVTESLSKNFGGRLLFVGTGQTALSGTPNLKKLMGRFQLSVELSDADVDRVIRKTILAKKPDILQELTERMEENLGEISRHLRATKIEHRTEDMAYLATDYPILPVRRRFWERTLRAVDQGGNESQLRNQLNIVHDATIQSAYEPVGTVVGGDFIFDKISTGLLQSGVLSREIYGYIASLRNGSEEDELKARVCSLIYLIGKLPQDEVADLGVRATAHVLADLLVQDLEEGSGELRKRLPQVLDALEREGKIMAIGEEYRLQTLESSAWHSDFEAERSGLRNHAQRVEHERVRFLRQTCETRLKDLRLVQGRTKESRATKIHFGTEAPTDLSGAVYLWFRDGWAEDDKNVLADARQAKEDLPIIYIYLPSRAGSEINRALIDRLAAKATLDRRGVPTTEMGREARRSMETTLSNAEKRLNEYVAQVFDSARVFHAGGQELLGSDLAEVLEEAAQNVLLRVFRRFDDADHLGWPKVLDLARKGSESALEALQFKGATDKHPVTRELLKYIGSGKKGADIRRYFQEPEFGWPRDAIDGGLLALLATGHLRAIDSGGRAMSAKNFERNKLAQITFQRESTTISAVERLKVRQLLGTLKIQFKPGEELSAVPEFLRALRELAANAGGEAPRPKVPSTAIIDEIAGLAGNDQLRELYERAEELKGLAKKWAEVGELIEERTKNWQILQELFRQVSEPVEADSVRTQADAILRDRLLLADPDLVPALVDELTQQFREALVAARADLEREYEAGEERLRVDENWQKLSPEQRRTLRVKHDVLTRHEVKTGTSGEVLESLRRTSLGEWANRSAALSTRYERILKDAAEAVLPDPVFLTIKGATIKNAEELEAWLEELRAQVEAKLNESKGSPVVVS